MSPRPSVPPTLTVTGHGRASTAADQAELSVGVEVVRPTAREARGSAAETMAAVVAAVRAAGVGNPDIATGALTLSAELDYADAGVPRRVGFRVGNRVTVVVREVERVAAVVDAAIEAGATVFDGVTFRAGDAAGPRREALTAAVLDARQRAEAIAAAEGLRLGPVARIREETAGAPPNPRFAVMEAAAGTPVLPGTLEVTATVKATWQLEPGEATVATEVRRPMA